MIEEWKPIKGYEGLYEISSFGVVKSLKGKNGVVFPKYDLSITGYWRVGLSKNKKQTKYLLHRLIAIAFIPNTENKPFINHKNGIKTDNKIENLEWCTASENMQHAHNNNLIKVITPVKKGNKFPQVQRGKNGHAKIVLDMQTGIFYDCAKDAADSIGMNEYTFRGKLNGNFKNTTQFIFV